MEERGRGPGPDSDLGPSWARFSCSKPLSPLGNHPLLPALQTSLHPWFSPCEWLDLLPWVVDRRKCAADVKVLRRLFFARKMNRGGCPRRVAAEASSTALPSSLPAAPSCCQLLGSQLVYPGVAGRGQQRQEHRYCALGSPRRPHLQRELLLQHSRLRQQLLGSAGFKFPFYGP